MAKTLKFFLSFLIISLCLTAGAKNKPESSDLNRAIALTVTNPDSSIILAQQVITWAQETDNKLLLSQAHHQLGFVYYNQNRFDEAEKQLMNCIAIAAQEGFNQELALAYNRLGNVHQLKANQLKALDYYLMALHLNRELSDEPEIARTLVNLANAYSVIGQYQRSIEHFLGAMNIHEATGDKDGMAWASLGIARLFKKLDLLDRAMQYAENALAYYQELYKETGNSIGITLSLNEIGSIYQKRGDYTKALEYTHRVLEINQQNKNLYGQSANYLSLGIIHLDLHQNQLAKENLTQALELKKQIADSIDFAPLYRYLGQIEMEEGRVVSANLFFQQSLEYAIAHRLLPEISEAYQSLSQVYTKQGKHNQALDAYKSHAAYRDSLNSSEISRLEMQYEFEKREKEQELLAKQREAIQQERLERHRVVLIFFVVAFVLAGALAMFIFHNYRLKRETNYILLRQNREISRQKQEIESQKEEIEQQRDYVTKQRDQIVDQQRLITDSITYASRIQTAALPSDATLKKLPWETFVFYKPKNIVSGDFYWTAKLPNGKILLAVADCTGHGVPGAFMSMLGIALLREITGKPKVMSPSQMLSKLRQMVMVSLNQQSGESSQADGMDMAIVIIDPNTLSMEYAGAYLSAIVVRRGAFDAQENTTRIRTETQNGSTLQELRGNKMPIGFHILEQESFTNQSLQLQKGDMLYLFSDGYADQFGGEKNIKFLLQNFRALLMDIHTLELDEQKQVLAQTIENYQGNQKQVDDMLVMGVRMN